MKHLYKTKVLLMIIVLIMIISSFSLPFNVSAAATPTIQMSVNKTAFARGEEVLLTLKLSESMQAMALQVDIDMAEGTFILEKLDILIDGLNGTYAGTKDGRLSLNWISDNLQDVNIPAGEILRVRMRVLEKAVLGEKTFSFHYVEACKGDLTYVDLGKGQEVTVEIVTPQKSQNVIDAETEIAKIDLDTLTASKESLDLITNAQIAFSKCSSEEKKLVSNADTLTAAVAKYNKLKEQQAEDEVAAQVKKEIQEYLENYYNKVSSCTPETVTLEDKVAVSDAMKEYTKKSAYIRKQLEKQYEHLKELDTAIKALEAQASAEAYADTFVPIFFENYQDILNMGVDSITYESEDSFTQLQTKITDAISFYDEILNDVGRERVKSEYEHLLKLLEKWEEIAVENTPETPATLKAYNAFRDTYMDLLMKSTDEVTMDDLDEITRAISEIKSMKPAVSGKLINEYEYLMELLNVLNNSGGSTVGATTGWSEDTNNTAVENVNQGTSSDSSPSVAEEQEESKRKTKIIVSVGDAFAIIILVLILTTVILYLLPICVTFILKKKQERRMQYDSEA